jgi:outer membrane protein assembly factor BamA
MNGGKESPKVIIDEVTFDGSLHLPDQVLEQVTASLKGKRFDGDSDWQKGIEENPLRSTWEDQGFVLARVNVKAVSLGGDANYQHFSVTVHVDEGLLYRVGSIQFSAKADSGFETNESSAGVTIARRKPVNLDELTSPGQSNHPIFPPEELRSLIPFREGDILSPRRIREAIDALRKLYYDHGYIDFVTMPSSVFDGEDWLVSIRFNLDEGQQYRIRRIDVSGLDANSEKALNWKMKPGNILDYELIGAFFKDNQTLLPAGASSAANLELRRNTKDGTADLEFRFLPCPHQ